jgi:acetyl-CoA/propionyl-CoA carboxylase biotin carboxyl carrier protein
VRGHSIEFRINGEDPGRNFLPAPGTVARWAPPAGPGVRVDAGVVAGDVITGAFDSLLAKLVVTGADRAQALERSRRALAEFEVDGMATALPFHRAVVSDPAFSDEPFRVHTRWIETEWDGSGVEPYTAAPTDSPESARETVVVEVGGRRLEVVLPGGLGGSRSPAGGSSRRPPGRRAGGGAGAAPDSDALVSPMQGTIVKLAVEDGQQVEAGDLVVVLEAMKMEQPITAHKSGAVTGLVAEVGATVSSGAVLCEIKS